MGDTIGDTEARLARLEASYATLLSAVHHSSANVTHIVTPLDVAWQLNTAMVIFLMQIGFAMLEVGFVRAKSTKSILMKNLLDCCITVILWWLLGAPFAVSLPIPTTSPLITHTLCAAAANTPMHMPAWHALRDFAPSRPLSLRWCLSVRGRQLLHRRA